MQGFAGPERMHSPFTVRNGETALQRQLNTHHRSFYAIVVNQINLRRDKSNEVYRRFDLWPAISPARLKNRQLNTSDPVPEIINVMKKGASAQRSIQGLWK